MGSVLKTGHSLTKACQKNSYSSPIFAGRPEISITGPDFDRTHPGCGDLTGDSVRLIDKPATCISLFCSAVLSPVLARGRSRARIKIIQLEKLADLDFAFSIVVGRGRTLCPFDGFLFGFHLDDPISSDQYRPSLSSYYSQCGLWPQPRLRVRLAARYQL